MSEQQAQEIPEERLAELKETFAIFDKDGSGSISSAELGTVLQSLGQNPTRAEIDEMIKEADTNNGNGMIEFDEFCQMMEKKKTTPEEEKQSLYESFKLFDKNKDGTISRDELKEVLCTMGLDQLTNEEFDEMMKVADIDGDGKISYEEFASKMAGSC